MVDYRDYLIFKFPLILSLAPIEVFFTINAQVVEGALSSIFKNVVNNTTMIFWSVVNNVFQNVPCSCVIQK